VLGGNYTTARPFEKFHQLQWAMHLDLLAAGLFTATSKKISKK
jgi:hypothetical protein